MDELPGLLGVVLLLSDEILSLPEWRQELTEGDND
ncbi:hypothetical protein STVIR_8231 [Streptomyces viridochromogenes Tue57]|uniref:Uncharacterized protein n=1 Tax=Streptomyces viridochromogenes Tue57 TaxID=1160705 RepID=L8NZS7_STRVR|nr:hypothetical protein STVIR_8231 [Streptomyces viridochromogenes Tue57]